MKISILVAAAALMTAACSSAQAANFEFWYGNTGSVEKAILAQCDAFNASQSANHVTCVGQGSYEVSMQKAIAAYRSNKHPVLIQFFRCRHARPAAVGRRRSGSGRAARCQLEQLHQGCALLL